MPREPNPGIRWGPTAAQRGEGVWGRLFLSLFVPEKFSLLPQAAGVPSPFTGENSQKVRVLCSINAFVICFFP